ncbi:MAG: nucleotidyl transferase AbiEii/AbiGii toxin family protein [Verrucomicrobia bacterium]|nr:nucleotidyl transferase AbiEii/AbiGii toxin family protein [Verrucomicrobiota bacterium]
MSSTYVRLSKPLEAPKADLLARIARLSADRGIPVLLFGATARDVLFEYAHGVPIVRRTMDVDVSVQMRTWADYDRFCATLRGAGFTNPHPGHEERFKDSVTGLEMDMLPYGEIAGDAQAIVWPADNSRWSVIGLEDAFRSALLLPLVAADGGSIEFPVASIPAQFMLKLIATYDRPDDRRNKDGRDLAFILCHCLEAGNRERLLSEATDILGRVGRDLLLAGALLLGRDLSAIVSPATRARVVEILTLETTSSGRCPVVHGMLAAKFREFRGDFQYVRSALHAARLGLQS